MKTEAQVLAEMLDSTRDFIKWYLSMLKDVDVYKIFELEGKKFNPVIWEIGHLANSENFLGTYLTGGKGLKFDWAPLFRIGVTPPSKENYPAYKDIWSTFKEVHKNTIKPHFIVNRRATRRPLWDGVCDDYQCSGGYTALHKA